MPITIRDIAEKANVSIATVSRVLNNSSQVSKETKDKVEKVIKELNFKPNVFARGLIKKSINTIGVILPDLNNLFYPAVIKGIEDELEKQNYNIFLCNTDESITKEKKYIKTLLEKHVDGIIFLGTRPTGFENNKHIVELSKKLPVLMINDYIIGSNVYSVMTDEVNGAYKAVNYFLSLGHKKIGFINGNVDFTTYKYKLRGYKKALEDNKIPLNEKYVINETPYEKGGYLGVKKLLSLKDRPTAIFTASDQIAIGAMNAIFESGYSSDDFSVIGYGDIPILNELYSGLTTVNQFPYYTGQLAAETIIKVINQEELKQRKIILEPELSIRKSCKALI
ncbi:MAG: LacI family transcriptional regulator [Halanaerobiales bacterium]|nr:LacI family transcriptional regulator [Halanaerobiales bacterium]